MSTLFPTLLPLVFLVLVRHSRCIELVSSFRYQRLLTLYLRPGKKRVNVGLLWTLDWEFAAYFDTRSLIADGKVRPDCGDIRFVSLDDSTFFHHWLEGGCNSEFTRYWVRIPIASKFLSSTSTPLDEFFHLENLTDPTGFLTKVVMTAKIKVVYGHPSLEDSGAAVWAGHFVLPSASGGLDCCPHGLSPYVGSGAYVRVVPASMVESEVRTVPYDPGHRHELDESCVQVDADTSENSTTDPFFVGAGASGSVVTVMATSDHVHRFRNEDVPIGFGVSSSDFVGPPFFTAHLCRSDVLDLAAGHLLICMRVHEKCSQFEGLTSDIVTNVSLGGFHIGHDRLLRATHSLTDTALSVGGLNLNPMGQNMLHTHSFSSDLSNVVDSAHPGGYVVAEATSTTIAAIGANHTHVFYVDATEAEATPPQREFPILLVETPTLLRGVSDGGRLSYFDDEDPSLRVVDPSNGLLTTTVFLATHVPPLGWQVSDVFRSSVVDDVGLLVASGTTGQVRGFKEHDHAILNQNTTSISIVEGVEDVRSIVLNVSSVGSQSIGSPVLHAKHVFPSSVGNCESSFPASSNLPLHSNLLLVSRKYGMWVAFFDPEDSESVVAKKIQWELVSVGIVAAVVTLVLLLGLAVFIPLVCFLRRRNATQSEKLRDYEQLGDIELLLAAQRTDADVSVAHLRIDEELFCVDFKDIRVMKKIGEGGSNSVVFLASYHETFVAVKMFRTSSICADQDSFGEFEREVSLLSSLLHPSIVSFFGATLLPPRVGFLMEFCSQGALSEFLAAGRKAGQPFPLKGRIRLLSEVASACAYLHSRSILHRDLKPENVLITSSVVAKLCDFGVSRSIKEQSAKTMKVGTNRFMAPEVALGLIEYGNPIDVFSFGVLMYEVVCGDEAYAEMETSTSNVEFKVANSPHFRPRLGDKEVVQDRPWLRDLMVASWSHQPCDRPTFVFLLSTLKERLAAWEGEAKSCGPEEAKNKDRVVGVVVGEAGEHEPSSSSSSSFSSEGDDQGDDESDEMAN